MRSPLASVEDEERFLRNLGWVPEEEDHVPELTEEEILETKKFLCQYVLSSFEDLSRRKVLPSENSNGKYTPNDLQSLKASIRKWQREKILEHVLLQSSTNQETKINTATTPLQHDDDHHHPILRSMQIPPTQTSIP